MRKLISFMHVSLDGYVAGLNGELDWITVDDELFNFTGKFTDGADGAVYGRVTFDLMDSYWPTAPEQPGASKHDVEHGQWYKNAEKTVLSRTKTKGVFSNTRFISGNLKEEITELKGRAGKNILLFGSPSALHSLMKERMIDEFWLFVNPVLIGQGIPTFRNMDEQIKLQLRECVSFASGVVGLNYQAQNA